jgi:alkanesulfonate monooxygenase SsuD/methylene tetrahydromethanopterin reductase-like flavin-dependent oxidoreductase (luciferase family)
VTAAPFIRSGPAAVLDLARRADRLGYGSLWVAEVTGIEAFSVLGAVSRTVPSLGLGTGVLPVQVRTAPLLAMRPPACRRQDALDSTLQAAMAPAARDACRT